MGGVQPKFPDLIFSLFKPHRHSWNLILYLFLEVDFCFYA